MKRIGRFITVSLALLLLSFPAYAEKKAVQTVPVESQSLSINNSGILSWKLTFPDSNGSFTPDKYEVVVDVKYNGNWKEGVKKFKCEESTAEITYTRVGLYRFKVRAHMVGGDVSEWSDYSAECTVTRDDINTDDPVGPVNPYNPVNPAGPGSGPGSQANALIVNNCPAWVETTGAWAKDASGQWIYINNGVQYVNKWGCIYNQYANTALGQRQYDWFAFDEAGHMRTGWYTEPGGSVYYLNPLSDGTMGRMVTGWAQINGFWYYFNNQEGSGQMGALLRNTRTPDGHYVDEFGRMVR